MWRKRSYNTMSLTLCLKGRRIAFPIPSLCNGQTINDIIHCAGCILAKYQASSAVLGWYGRWGLLSHAQNAVRWLVRSIYRCTLNKVLNWYPTISTCTVPSLTMVTNRQCYLSNRVIGRTVIITLYHR